MNTAVLNLFKQAGDTPLEALERLRAHTPTLRDEILGYAGRLDPMAEGVLVVLVGEENKKRAQYELLPKTYEFELLLGISTDTYDGLGIVNEVREIPDDWKEELHRVLNEYPRTFDQPYPPYSSARVNGKPLFYWAREGKIETIQIPAKRVSIEHIEIGEMSETTLDLIIPPLFDRIKRISGTFRQHKIIARWKQILAEHPNQKVGKARIKVHCSSGLYIRSLCNDVGLQMHMGGIAYAITRIAAGEMTIDDALRI